MWVVRFSSSEWGRGKGEEGRGETSRTANSVRRFTLFPLPSSLFPLPSHSPTRVLLQIRLAVHLAELDLKVGDREPFVARRERLGGRQVSTPGLFGAAAHAG